MGGQLILCQQSLLSPQLQINPSRPRATHAVSYVRGFESRGKPHSLPATRTSCNSHRLGAGESRLSQPECTWTPPSEPAAPRVAPEFSPPSDPGTIFRPPPEYAPPQQRPNEETRRGDPPLRPVRPEQEPLIPTPESPNADPVRTPERRKEITEPTPEERPGSQPERE